MKDLLLRLPGAMPRFRSWMADLHSTYAATAQQVSSIASPTLSTYWPADLLMSSRAVVVQTIPFPPVVHYELPEFESMADMAKAGVTFGHVYFLQEGHASESVHFHELVHVVQWNEVGLDDFLFTYALGIAQTGYFQSPFESAAYDAQKQFDDGGAIPGLVASIQSHARKHRDEAAEVFRQHGVRMNA